MKQSGRFARTKEAVPKKKGKKPLIAVCVFVLLAGLLVAFWLATADLRYYQKGLKLLEKGEYNAAAVIFESLGDYEDAPAQLREARYGIAVNQMEMKAYLEAAEHFEQLEDYRDSAERKGKCYYSLANKERLAKNYEQAREYYALAGDYQDAATQIQRMIYAMGHEAFLEGDYTAAESWFSQMAGTQEDYGNPHFQTLEDAAEYLDQQLENLNGRICFHIGEEPDEDFYLALRNYLPYHYGSPSYYAPDKLVTITVLSYYPGDKILDAWENADTTGLTEEENSVLNMALTLVNQAREETDSDLAMELWLHDWLCGQVYYESPEMDIKARDYVELRELSCIGAMLDGKANCQGYTDAFYLLANLAGLEVTRLFGDTGEGHTWNMIHLEEQWYIVDVTFDDLSNEEYDGWTYTHFNAPWDPEVYAIWGGEKVLPGIAVEFDPELSYFGLMDSSFSDMRSAANYLVSRYAGRGEDWAYVVLEDTQADWEAFSQAIKNSLFNYCVYSVSWVEWMEEYAGNTYMSVYWD